MIRALDILFGRTRPARRPSGPDTARPRPRRAEIPSLREPNRFERDSAEQLWSAPAHWRL
ncbi:hypothetical protein JYP51_20750 [Ponticoccus gilvus]|nr:hypothetical protein [Enemella evansiae]